MLKNSMYLYGAETAYLVARDTTRYVIDTLSSGDIGWRTKAKWIAVELRLAINWHFFSPPRLQRRGQILLPRHRNKDGSPRI